MSLAIELEQLTVEFQSGTSLIRAVDSLGMRVRSGTVFGFLGPNGAGKTTVIHVLLGFISATSGKALILGGDVRSPAARQRIGYLPEHAETYSFLTGRELLDATGRLFGMKGAVLAQRINEMLDRTGMTAAADRRIATYSKGMTQRICLAQALINDPELVIMDEPTGGLDPFGRMAVREIIADLRKRGKTVFFSSHELSEVETVCDELAVMSAGRLIVQGALGSIVPPGRSLEKYFLEIAGGASQGTPGTGESS